MPKKVILQGKRNKSCPKTFFLTFFNQKHVVKHSFRMLTLHIASKTEYFVGLRRVKPMYFLIALEPCHLLFAVDMSVVTDALLRLLEGIVSFKIHKHLLPFQ